VAVITWYPERESNSYSQRPRDFKSLFKTFTVSHGECIVIDFSSFNRYIPSLIITLLHEKGCTEVVQIANLQICTICISEKKNMSEWTKSKYPGIRYRESKTETVGVGRSKRPKRYYTMTFKLNGLTKSEGFGWEGDIVMGKHLTEGTAYDIYRMLSGNRRDKTPPFTLAEYRKQNEKATLDAQLDAQKESARNITFGEIFTKHYFSEVQHNRKSLRSIKREEELFRLWIDPVIGARPIREIMPLHLEKVKKDMFEAGRSARSIQYALAVTRQVFNFAIKNRFFPGRNPADKAGGVNRPKVDNRRTRFLSKEEARDLLLELKRRSADVHDMALFSLHTGARAGEIFNLKWVDVDIPQMVIMFRDTKSGRNRAAYITEEVKAMLAERRPENAQGDALVFPGRGGAKITEMSDSFNRSVEKLKMNDGRPDRLTKVTFHTLRHTFASWLAIEGVNPFHLKELMGHSDLKLTERYSHLSDESLREAAMKVKNR